MQTSQHEYVAVRSAGRVCNCIFLSWEDAAEHLATDLQGAKYKVFRSLVEAESYLSDGRTTTVSKKRTAAARLEEEDEGEYNQFLGHNIDDSEDEGDQGIAAALPKATSYKPTKRWETMFQNFAHTAVDGNLPEDFEDPKLKVWVKQQHIEFNKLLRKEQSAMSKEKMERLTNIGFVFRKACASDHEKIEWSREFDCMMDKMHEFRKENGHCRVMRSNVEHRDLSNWTVKVRREYQKLSSVDEGHKCRLSARQLQRLTDIGFLFRQKESYKNWTDRMNDLFAFQAAGNDINSISTSHPILGEFITRMRKEYKLLMDGHRSPMTKERVEALEKIGFDWNLERRRDKATLSKPKSWDERYRELLDYKQQHGHTCVPQQQDGGLGYWVKSQRQSLKLFLSGQKSSLSAEKVSRLTAIGFIVDAKDYRKRQRQEEATTGGPDFDYDSPFCPTQQILARFRL